MKINAKAFFAKAKEAGLSAAQLSYSKSDKLSFSIFDGEVDSYTASSSASLSAIGMYQGKLGSAASEKFDLASLDEIIEAVKESALYKSEERPVGLYEGAPKYKKRKLPKSDLSSISPSKKIEIAKGIYKDILASDPRITPSVTVMYADFDVEACFYNDKGIRLPEKDGYGYFMAEVPIVENGVTKTGFSYKVFRRLEEFDPKAFVEEAVKDAAGKLGATSIKSGHYPVVFKNTLVGDFLEAFMDAASGEAIEKKSSWLLGKLNQQIVSPKVTITEKPLEPTVSYGYFDDEGVPCQTKDIVKKGVLMTYLHNRETAARAGTVSTGNGSFRGGKFHVDAHNVYLKGTKKTFEELIAPIKKGIYITDLGGLGTGLNSVTGNFSAQAEGFLIEDGKLTKPLALITVGGNILQMFSDIKGIDGRYDPTSFSPLSPDIYIKKMQIGGE